MNLAEKAASFLAARDYEIQEKGDDFIAARRTGVIEREERTRVWVSEAPPNPATEEHLLDRALAVDTASVNGILLSVAPNVQYSAPFRRDCNDLKVRILSPAQFFDAPYTYDSDQRAAGIVKGLADEGRSGEARRVPQPFRIASGPDSRVGDGDDHRDLSDHLLTQVKCHSQSPAACLWIVAAPAGYGKTRLFSSLFAKIYDEFQNRKKRSRLFPRPFPMVSDHLRKAAGPNITGLIDAFVKMDFAHRMSTGLFDWMVGHGHAVWMLDGLDEVISGDRDFAESVLGYLTAPFATPLILISVRDSVLRSNEELAELIDSSGQSVTVFELEPWAKEQKRQLVWLKEEGRLPHQRLRDDQRISKTVEALDGNRAVRRITQTPFYADMVVDELREGPSFEIRDELHLLNTAVDRMCEREYNKGGPFQESILPRASFREWLEEVAAEVVESDGISTERLMEMADLVNALVETSDEDAAGVTELVEQIKGMPFLRASGSSGGLEFDHEILGDYLAGSFYARQASEQVRRGSLRQKPSVRLGRYLGHHDLPNDSLCLLTMARRFEGEPDLLTRGIVESPACGYGIALKNALRLIALLENGRGIIDNARLSLEGCDLSGVDFRGLDLNGMRFVGADLSFANLEHCGLKGAKFEAARFRTTRLPAADTGWLDGASFGNAQNFVSVRVGNREIADYEEFRRWLARATRRQMDKGAPCPAVRQLEFVFGKFVRPSGRPRRDQIDERGLYRGRQDKDVPSNEAVVKEIIKCGYLEKRPKNRVGRPAAEKYADVVQFVRDCRAISPGLREVVESVCGREGCSHVGHAGERVR